MHFRSSIPDCKGVNGVKGRVGIKWYKVKFDEISGFVSCQACYEDHILTSSFAAHLESAPPQPADDTWACDMAISFIQKEYDDKGKLNDWASFVAETKNGLFGLILCAACYCDQVIHTGEEPKWEAARQYTQSYDTKVLCGMGIFSIGIAMARAHETKDFQAFWTAVHKLSREKFCDDDGIEDGVWYTLLSDPIGFAVCAGCYVAIAEALGVSRFFVRKQGVPPGTKWLCCFNLAHPRLKRYMPRLLEMYFTLDPTSFDRFVSVHASIPVCGRDENVKNRHWCGWFDCTICPECYAEFAHHSPLAAKMELKSTFPEDSTMCEMYSARMRTLYKECSEASPLDLGPLLTYSVQRRMV
ncbi:hypothetical protein AAE478_007297 [Parahypoxylon ruwenzoriense]